METVRTVELFAGVGGFRLGLEVASDRYKIVWGMGEPVGTFR